MTQNADQKFQTRRSVKFLKSKQKVISLINNDNNKKDNYELGKKFSDKKSINIIFM